MRARRNARRTRERALRPYLHHDSDVLAFAHRGGAMHPEIVGLENSFAAFEHAAALGYTYLETDVHVTADGVLLAFHDDALDRVTDRVGRISDLTHEEVQAARIAGREPVPVFAELLAAFPAVRFNVDLKADGAVEPLARVIAEQDAQDRVLVGSFSRRRLRHFRRVAPDVATSAHPGEVAAYLLSPFAWLARLLTPGRPDALQIPHRRRGLVIATRGLVRRARANGVAVHVWTIDDPEEMDVLLERGVDGLMTDRTDILKQTLTRHGLWKDLA